MSVKKSLCKLGELAEGTVIRYRNGGSDYIVCGSTLLLMRDAISSIDHVGVNLRATGDARPFYSDVSERLFASSEDEFLRVLRTENVSGWVVRFVEGKHFSDFGIDAIEEWDD